MCKGSDDPRDMVGDAERAVFGLAMLFSGNQETPHNGDVAALLFLLHGQLACATKKLEGFVPRQ